MLRRVMPVLTVRRDGAILLVDTADGGYGRKLVINGVTPDMVVLDRAVGVLRARGQAAEGSGFVDVGAHIGTTSLRAVVTHGFGRVLAFEPDAANARLLRASVALNGLESRVEVVEAAVAGTNGTALFGRGPQGPSGRLSGEGGLDRSDVPGSEAVLVETTTLDAACGPAADDVGLVWIDAQGHEPEALSGASRLLARRVPVVFALRPRRAHPLAAERLELLRAAGYDTVVDLRHPAIYVPGWEPAPRPIADLFSMLDRERNTDVLVFTEAEGGSRPS